MLDSARTVIQGVATDHKGATIVAPAMIAQGFIPSLLPTIQVIAAALGIIVMLGTFVMSYFKWKNVVKKQRLEIKALERQESEYAAKIKLGED